MKKVIIGMSGGVDSSVAAYLLKQQGMDVVGVTMQTLTEEESLVKAGWQNPAVDAKKVAEAIGIPHVTVDFRKEFKDKVMDYFVSEYLHGRTPNPCVVCNRFVKWEALLSYGKTIGAEYVATGHYATIHRCENGRFCIKNGVSAAKDQSYALYNLTQEQLAHTLMPIGDFEKTQIRELALQAELPVADKPDSQDICFIPDNDYIGFLKRKVPHALSGPGNFVDRDGKVLGKHKGIEHYTIGQRRGLELAMGKRIFVLQIRPETNEVVIGDDKDTFTNRVICKDVNFMSISGLQNPMRVKAKIRYNHTGEYGVIQALPDNRVVCEFEKPVRASAPGQAMVFYDGECVAGGGVIV